MCVRSILKKSLRSLLRKKGAYMACVIVLSLGIAVFISMLSILEQIENGINSYYEENRFGQVFAKVTAMPENALANLTRIDGVKAADGFLTAQVRLNIEGETDIITVKLMGAEEEG